MYKPFLDVFELIEWCCFSVFLQRPGVWHHVWEPVEGGRVWQHPGLCPRLQFPTRVNGEPNTLLTFSQCPHSPDHWAGLKVRSRSTCQEILLTLHFLFLFSPPDLKYGSYTRTSSSNVTILNVSISSTLSSTCQVEGGEILSMPEPFNYLKMCLSPSRFNCHS